MFHRLDAEGFQTLFEHPRRQVAQRQPGGARGVISLEHGTILEKGVEFNRQFKKKIAKEIGAIFLRHRLQCQPKIEQMLGQRNFFRRGQLNVEC